MRICRLVLALSTIQVVVSSTAAAQPPPASDRHWAIVAEGAPAHFSWGTIDQTIATVRAGIERDLTRTWGIRAEVGRRQPGRATVQFASSYFLDAPGSPRPVEVLAHGQLERRFLAEVSVLASARRTFVRAGRLALLLGLTSEVEHDTSTIGIPVGSADNYTLQIQSQSNGRTRGLATIGVEYAAPITRRGSLMVSGRAAKEVRVEGSGDTVLGAGVGWRVSW